MQIYSSSELEKLQSDLPYLIQVYKWIENYLAQPHSDLGRSGKVCPYVPLALKNDTIRLSIIRNQNLSQMEILEIVRNYRDVFLQTEPTTGEIATYKAFLLVFPDVTPAETSALIDEVQQQLKPFFVEAGLMLGEFHANNPSPGLHNPDFRPLRSPIPMLAIRFMVEQDLPFLSNRNDAPEIRMHYLQNYLQRFANTFKDTTNWDRAWSALDLARKEIIGLEEASSNSSQRDNSYNPNSHNSVSTNRKCPFSSIFNLRK